MQEKFSTVAADEGAGRDVLQGTHTPTFLLFGVRHEKLHLDGDWVLGHSVPASLRDLRTFTTVTR